MVGHDRFWQEKVFGGQIQRRPLTFAFYDEDSGGGKDDWVSEKGLEETVLKGSYWSSCRVVSASTRAHAHNTPLDPGWDWRASSVHIFKQHFQNWHLTRCLARLPNSLRLILVLTHPCPQLVVYSKIGCRRTHVLRGQAGRSYLQAAFLYRTVQNVMGQNFTKHWCS